MICTKADALDGLQSGRVLPITSLTKTPSVVTASGNNVTVTRQQLLLAPAHAFTDCRSQAQTIKQCIHRSCHSSVGATDALQLPYHGVAVETASGCCTILMSTYLPTIHRSYRNVAGPSIMQNFYYGGILFLALYCRSNEPNVYIHFVVDRELRGSPFPLSTEIIFSMEALRPPSRS
ncbi:hypothetical protein SCLCIDRAFT_215724 [Scleroderma citrinum Foug A]|uniref:Uncharacterized protein n=1 Tax=Scleroderma citrinum Foug A TaxID=1036808 RepID=A0A0C3APX7_9AGAM|nr:hypothetical protein SCLCIDRAFT_215724 [Scleroderma citrinum Foug A]